MGPLGEHSLLEITPEMSVHELVSCACGASVDVVFIPPELLGGQPVVAARRVAPMPGSAMSRIAAWDAPVSFCTLVTGYWIESSW